MSETTDRIPCPHCQASNFPTSAVCWQCGRALRAESQPPAETPPAPGAPPPYQPPPPYQQPADTGQTFIILGFIFSAIGLLCCPILFSTLAIVFGVMAKNKGNPLGVWVIGAGIVSLVLGIIIGVALGILNWSRFARTNPFGPSGVPRFP